jgi:EpsI family protein
MPELNLHSILNNKYARILSVILVAQAVMFYTASRGESAPPEQPLIGTFPTAVGTWRMTQQGVVDKETQDILRADDTLTRSYASTAGGVANLFVAYFHTQRTGQSPHSPKNCLPGSGWTQTVSGYLDVPIPSRNETIQINRYIVSKADAKSAVLYWYQTPKRVIADEYHAKFWLVADSVTTHRSDTSLVRVVVPIVNDRDQAAVDTGIRFVQAMYPVLRQQLPL